MIFLIKVVGPIFFELLLCTALSIPFGTLDFFDTFSLIPGTESRFGKTFWLLATGGIIGWLSLVVYPHAFLTVPFLRVINLGFAPLTSGYVMWFISRVRGIGDPQKHFWYPFLFTLGIAFARLIWASLN